MKRLTEMTYTDFEAIFGIGYGPTFMMLRIETFWTLHGFHDAIAKYGNFESHRRAIELGYDVEFTLDR